MFGKKVPDFFSEWTKPRFPSLSSVGGELIYSMVSISTLLERAKKILALSSKDPPNLTSEAGLVQENLGRSTNLCRTDVLERLAGLIPDILALDNELNFWAHLPALTPEQAARSDGWVVGNWNFYLASCLILNRLLEIRILHLLQPTVRPNEQDDVQRDDINNNVELVNADIQFSVSFALSL